MSALNHAVPRGLIVGYLTDILRDVMADWDIGEIRPDARLGELGIASINLVYLVGEAQQTYGLHDRLFQRLRAAGRPLTELRIDDVADLVCELLSNRTEVAEGVGA